MKTVRFFLVVLFVLAGTLTSCDLLLNPPPVDNGDPSPQPDLLPRLEERTPPIDPPYSESCSDIPERAVLENAEANPYEIWMACIIKNHPEQSRPTMSYHPLLGEVARMRADDLALRGEEWRPGHIDSQGFGPNYYVCLVGYEASFCLDGNPRDNFIESLSGGEDPEATLQGWLNSPGHRRHVLAETSYTVGQLYYGIGHAYVTLPPDYTYGIGVYIFIATHPPLDEEMD